jgi:hypothetical protein
VLEAFDPSEAAGVSTYTAVVKQDGDSWFGWVGEVSGVNAQERTRERLLVSLKVALQEAPTRTWRWPCEAPRAVIAQDLH